jgi:hypothetical protein
MDEKWSAASICIVTESMSPQEISNVLGIEESRSYNKGDPISRKKIDGPVRSESLWVFESDIEPSYMLDCHIEKLVEIIEKNIESFKLLLSRCKIEIFCGFSSGNGQGGFTINSDLLKRLTIIPMDIVFDLYPPEGKNDICCTGIDL